MKNLSPVILIVYNRPEHTKKTIEALKINTLASKSMLYIYSDGSSYDEKVKEVRKYIHTVEGFREVHIVERKENIGLANNIIEAATEVINKYGKVILVEDDLVSSPYFLKFMNDGLEKYKDNHKVGSVSGFMFPKTTMQIPDLYEYEVFFSLRPSSWGWATWKDKWGQIDWRVEDFNRFKRNLVERYRFNKGGGDLSRMLQAQMQGSINSWAIRWSYNFYKRGWVSVYPTVSFIDNQGNDNSGVHSKASNKDKYGNKELNMNSNIKFPDEIFLDREILKRFKRVYSKNMGYYLSKIKYKLQDK
jgi:hypothetical protein